MANFSDLRHLYTLDYRQGFDDGCTDNPYENPSDREGDALNAYLSGYADGVESFSIYLDQQSCED